MRLGARNSGNSIRPWAARRLAAAPTEHLASALQQAETRRHLLSGKPDCATRRSLLSRENWLIRCLKEELSRREEAA